MQISDKGLALIKVSEGFRNHTYLDIAGLPTIGYGHKLTAGESFPNGITEDQASAILTHDAIQAKDAVLRLVKVSLTQGQFDALVDFVFNLGSGRLASSTLLVDLNDGNYDATAEQILRWDHSGDKEVVALKARREAEVELWLSSVEEPSPA